jgi:DNA invertase Pin-like site-specific DNA recombinase
MRRLDNRRARPVEKLQKHAALHTAARLLQPAYPCARTFGYARVSRDDQNLDMQFSALRQAGVSDENMFAEKISAVNAHRPLWHLITKIIEPGDRLVFYAYNRLCRDLRELLSFVDDMKLMGVTLISTTQPHILPYTTDGRMILSLTGTWDEHERNKLRDRTKDGMRARKEMGMNFGRERIVTPTVARKMQKLRDAGVRVKDIPKRLRLTIKPSTVYANTIPKA